MRFQKIILPEFAALVVASAFVLCLNAAPDPPNVGPDPGHAAKMARGLEIFKDHIRPLLAQRCLRCHGGKATEAEFSVNDRDQLMRGGKSGAAIAPADAGRSLLYQLVSHQKEPHMPHGAAKLAPLALAHLKEWIECGAPYDKPLRSVPLQEASWTEKQVPASARQFWSFQPLNRAGPPKVQNVRWARNPIDRFILARLEAARLKPNLVASKRQLIRRLYFDLIGLPPTPEDIDRFVRDPDPYAYERLVDRLLASPQYGERWGRHWLDLARYAESHGFEQDYDRPSAYHYRDFVIRALNADLRYDTFVRWQIAGDELKPEDQLALAATGFLAAGVHSTQITKREVEKQRYDELDDMAATVGTALLGLTIGCARCHDHKFDPVPQADYYRLVSTFTTTVRSEIDFNLDPAGYEKAKAGFERQHAPLAAALAKFEDDVLPGRQRGLDERWSIGMARRCWLAIDAMPIPGPRFTALVGWRETRDPDWLRLKREVQAHVRKAPKPKVTKILVASEGLRPIRLHTQGDDFFKETYFLKRGDPDQKERVARQGFLQVLASGPEAERRWQCAPPAGWRTSYRRRALADWICDVDKGAGALLARVIVNRLWQHHLGRGIVATPSEFGARGERPSHPELLDWLASELVRNGWRLKPIHRLIVTSAVYMENSSWDEEKAKADPHNALFGRAPRRRLEAEAIRDALLCVSGKLDAHPFGPGTLDEKSRRRSVYFTIKHSNLISVMQIFDAPDAIQGVGERSTTTVAPQALFFMNSPSVHLYAHEMAKRVGSASTQSADDSIRRAYLIAFGRPPTVDEASDSRAFLRSQSDSYRASGRDKPNELALADFCQALLCLNEFVYVD